jgi:hypothetical protein
VIEALVALAKTAPETILKEIAGFDSHARAGDDVKHLAALKALWTTYECRLNRQPNNSWYPSEPIELASYAVDGQSQTLSAYCNVILLIADLEDGHMGYMGYRSEVKPGRAWFEALPEDFRGPLVAGLDMLLSERSEQEIAFWAENRGSKGGSF